MEVMTLKDKPKMPLDQFIEIIKAYGVKTIYGGSENGKIVIKLKRV